MFHGQPYCGTCDYEGPDFMWTWHHGWGFGVLVQNRESLELRVVEVPDDEVFYRGARQEDKKADQAVAAYVDAVVARQLRPGERPVDSKRIWRFVAEEGNEPHVTDLPCPRCRSLLLWRHTGIS